MRWRVQVKELNPGSRRDQVPVAWLFRSRSRPESGEKRKGGKGGRTEKELAPGREAEASQRLGQGAALGVEKQPWSPDLVWCGPPPHSRPKLPARSRFPRIGSGEGQGAEGRGKTKLFSLLFFFFFFFSSQLGRFNGAKELVKS